jgi:hypothetical protein
VEDLAVVATPLEFCTGLSKWAIVEAPLLMLVAIEVNKDNIAIAMIILT